MELVYLWVEDYKNIHKQGFNFSPRFTCDYDDVENELTIKENDDYIENFFGENINVTAIVGKNGSGKSSILNIIEYLTFPDNHKGSSINPLFKYILCFQNTKNNKILVKTNIENILNQYNSATLIYIKHSEYDTNTIDKYIKLIKKFELYKKTNLHSLSFMYIPKKIKIKINPNKDLNYIILNYMDSEYYNSIDEWGSGSKKDNEKELLRQSVEELSDSKKILLSSKIDKNIEKSEIEHLIKRLNNDIEQEQEYKYLKNILNNFVEIDKEIIDYIDNIKDFVEIDFKDKNDVYFKYLSSGEQHYSILFLESYENIISSDSHNIVYGIDEAETFLHPDWQKRLIKDLLKIFKNMDKNIHFILTSHSPFLLSDIPKQNIIFLDKDEEGNCKVVNGLKEKKQTFGANIHTLLSDSFFMENGLMGEFAKGKINKIIRFLNGKNRFIDFPIEQIEKVINTIGEPFLKEKLSKMYFDKFDTKKQDRIKELKAELKRLEHG